MTTLAGQKSKQAFIEAAGKLFAEKGIERVCLSEIAKCAGVDASMINYHFGGKEGLVQAVIEKAFEHWHEGDVIRYHEENKSLLGSRDGQIIFITGLVEKVFLTLGNKDGEVPATSVLLQLLQYPHPLRKLIVERHINKDVRCFCGIYKEITGNEDFESAFCWYLFMICPLYMYSGSPGMIDMFHLEGGVTQGFDRRLQRFTTRQLLAGFGLR